MSYSEYPPSATPEYRAWTQMKSRCFNASNPSFKIYGGRGITVCDQWASDFGAFFKCLGARPSARHSLDRINPDGNYEPGNCRWATPVEQANNKRNNSIIVHAGKSMTISQWARHLGVKYHTLHDRLCRHKMGIAESLVSYKYQPRPTKQKTYHL